MRRHERIPTRFLYIQGPAFVLEHQGIAHAGLAAKTYIERFKQMPKVDALECVLEQILR
jgi:hypothetical protein